MVPNPFMTVIMPKKGDSAKVDCPVVGKGFSSITLKTNSNVNAAGVSTSTIGGLANGNYFMVTITPSQLRFNGGDNTVPKTLYFMNFTDSPTIVTIFIEEVGSNPV